MGRSDPLGPARRGRSLTYLTKGSTLIICNSIKLTEAPVPFLGLYERKQCEEKDHHDVHWSGVKLGLTSDHPHCLYRLRPSCLLLGFIVCFSDILSTMGWGQDYLVVFMLEIFFSL